MCIYLSVYDVHVVPLEARRGHGIPSTGVAGGCESPYVGVGNQTQGFCESRKLS